MQKACILLAVFSIGGMIIYLAHNRTIYQTGVMEENVPMQAIKWMKEHKLEGRLFAPFGWGGFIGWQTGNHIKILMDGRIDHYGLDVFEANTAIEYGLPTCLSNLKKYQVEMILTSPQGPQGLYRAITSSGEWALVYFDEACELFLLRNEDHQEMIRQYEYRYVDPLKNPYYTPDNIKASLEELDRAIATSPKAYVPRYLKGDMLLMLGHEEAAWEEFKRVLKVNANHLGTLHSLGLSAMKQGRYYESETYFNRVLKHTHDKRLQAEMYIRCALLYEAQGNYSKAVSLARRAHKKRPDSEEVKQLLALFKKKQEMKH